MFTYHNRATRSIFPIFPYDRILDFSNGIKSMNTYQVHLVARRCTLVREHARAVFLSLENVGTAVRLNRPGYLDGSPSSRLLSAIDLKRADFVWDAARPVDHRGICSSIIVAAIALARHAKAETGLFGFDESTKIETTRNCLTFVNELFETCNFVENV